MDEKKKIEKDTVKDVLTTSAFEQSNTIENRLVNEKGKTNLSFGMRCFFWLVFSTVFILFLNIIGINVRLKNSSKGIIVETQAELQKYENTLRNRVEEEYNYFKDPILVQELVDEPRKILDILLNVQSEDNIAFYIKSNGEILGTDKNGNIKIASETETYKELTRFLNDNKDVVESEEWFFEKTAKQYRKLIGYKIYNADGTLNGMIAYTSAIPNPISMLKDIHRDVGEMSFYIFDKNQNLIYTNNDKESTIDAMLKQIKDYSGKEKNIIWNNDVNANSEDTEEEEEIATNNGNIGFLPAQLAKNVGNALKMDSISFSVNNFYEETGFTIFLDYRLVIINIIRNLVFFYTAGVLVILLVLYVMTYFYKYTKSHAVIMLRTVSFGILGAVVISIIMQMVSFMISSSNLAREEGTILGDAIFTNVSLEQYLEYIALVNHVDLSTEIDDKKKLLEEKFAKYYERFGLEYIETTIYPRESYLSERAKTQIAENGAYIKLKKSGGERYIEIETIQEMLVRDRKIWMKLNAHIETKVRSIYEPMITNFGEYDAFEIVADGKTFKLDTSSKYYNQIEKTDWNTQSNEEKSRIEINKSIVTTKVKLNLAGYSYIISYKNYDVAFIFLIVAVSMIVYVGMYFDLIFTIKNTKDEDTTNEKYKHLMAEWLSGNITIINEDEKTKETEYDENLLERLRKTNIERLTHVKKEKEQTDDLVDEDETYAKIKKEKDIFGISLFSQKRTRINQANIKSEFGDGSPQETITEIKDTVVNTIQKSTNENQELFDAEKLKVAQERLAIKQVLDEIEEKKNDNEIEDKVVDEREELTFEEDLELSSKDERLDEKIDNKK